MHSRFDFDQYWLETGLNPPGVSVFDDVVQFVFVFGMNVDFERGRRLISYDQIELAQIVELFDHDLGIVVGKDEPLRFSRLDAFLDLGVGRESSAPGESFRADPALASYFDCGLGH